MNPRTRHDLLNARLEGRRGLALFEVLVLLTLFCLASSCGREVDTTASQQLKAKLEALYRSDTPIQMSMAELLNASPSAVLCFVPPYSSIDGVLSGAPPATGPQPRFERVSQPDVGIYALQGREVVEEWLSPSDALIMNEQVLCARGDSLLIRRRREHEALELFTNQPIIFPGMR